MSQSKTSLFRQTSSKRLSSPDQLDQLLQVTERRGWIALIGVLLLTCWAAVWAFTGLVPVKVVGQGILLKSGGIQEIAAGTAGRIIDMAVSVGDQVREGQVVARIAQPQIAERLLQAKVAQEHARAEYRQVVDLGKRQLDLQVLLLQQQQDHLKQSIEATQASLKWLEERRANQQQLVSEGRLTKQALINTLQQYDAARERIRELRDQLADIDVRRLQGRASYEREVHQSRAKATEADGRVAQLERELGVLSDVVSSYTGRVIELMVEPGSVIDTGMPLMSLDLAGRTVKELEAVLYVPARDGKRLKAGMSIQLAPSTVRPEEYGQMLGRVTYVSDFPTTSRGMQRVLKNPELVDALLGGSSPHEVHADLLPDATTVSGYRWSSPGGPPMRVQSGTMCRAEITVESRRPIEMVVPILRRLGGL
jgi:HlyD family secretion protein